MDRARTLLDVGFEALVLAGPLYRTDWEELRPLLPRESILAVELFLPLPREVRPGRRPPGWSSPFSLGSLSREEKRDAEKYGPPTITFAHDQGARYVLLPSIELDQVRRDIASEPGSSGSTSTAREHPGTRETPRPPEVQAHMDSYLSSLDRLLAVADRYEVTLAITPAGSKDPQMPDVEETERCLAEFRGAPLCVWPDTARHALAENRDHGVPWRRFESIPGVTVRDVDDAGRACLPDEGILEWSPLIGELEAVPRWLVDPSVEAGADQIVHALEFLRGRLVDDEATDPLFPG